MSKAPETVSIAIVFADDTVGIMSFVTTEFHPTGGPRWMREDSDEEIQKEIDKTSKSFAPEKIPVKRWHRIEKSDLPKDRTYRNALRHDGKKFGHDLEHARALHRDLIRQARAPLFAENDVALRDAIADTDQSKLNAARTRRDRLRDATKHPAIANAKTIDELKEATIDKVV